LKTAQPPKRTKVLDRGRRTVIDYESPTVQRILSAAEEKFAQNSFPGTGVEDIAAAAGVNKASIYYHIGNKEKLYQEVLKRHATVIVEHLERELADCDDPIAGLRGVLRIHAEEFQKNARSTRTMAHELACGSQHMTPEIADIFGRIIGMSARFVEMGVERKLFPPQDPFLVHLSMIGPLFLTFLSSAVIDPLAQTVQADPTAPSKMSEMAAFLQGHLLPGLQHAGQDEV
jgi:TetR/AcrR family transcriptional regulator